MVFSKGLPGFFCFFFRGAKSFEESALEAEEHWNECIKEVLWKGGFGAPSENLGEWVIFSSSKFHRAFFDDFCVVSIGSFGKVSTYIRWHPFLCFFSASKRKFQFFGCFNSMGFCFSSAKKIEMCVCVCLWGGGLIRRSESEMSR